MRAGVTSFFGTAATTVLRYCFPNTVRDNPYSSDKIGFKSTIPCKWIYHTGTMNMRLPITECAVAIVRRCGRDCARFSRAKISGACKILVAGKREVGFCCQPSFLRSALLVLRTRSQMESHNSAAACGVISLPFLQKRRKLSVYPQAGAFGRMGLRAQSHRSGKCQLYEQHPHFTGSARRSIRLRQRLPSECAEIRGALYVSRF